MSSQQGSAGILIDKGDRYYEKNRKMKHRSEWILNDRSQYPIQNNNQNQYRIKDENKLKNYILNGNKEKCLKLLYSLLDNDYNSVKPVAGKKKILFKIYDLCKRILASINITEKEIMATDYIDLLNNEYKYKINQIHDYVINLASRITDKIPKNHKRKINLTEIIDYINKNYTDDISLEIIADDYKV